MLTKKLTLTLPIDSPDEAAADEPNLLGPWLDECTAPQGEAETPPSREEERQQWHDDCKTGICWASALLIVAFECYLHATCRNPRSLQHVEGDEECLESADQSYLLSYLSVVECVCRCTTAVVLVEFLNQLGICNCACFAAAASYSQQPLCGQARGLLQQWLPRDLSRIDLFRWMFLLMTMYVGLESESEKPANWVGVYAHLCDLVCRVITTTVIVGILYEVLRGWVEDPANLFQRCLCCRYDWGAEGLEAFDDHGPWVRQTGSKELTDAELDPSFCEKFVTLVKWLLAILIAVTFYIHENTSYALPWIFQTGLTLLNTACWAAYAWAIGHVLRWIWEAGDRGDKRTATPIQEFADSMSASLSPKRSKQSSGHSGLPSKSESIPDASGHDGGPLSQPVRAVQTAPAASGQTLPKTGWRKSATLTLPGKGSEDSADAPARIMSAPQSPRPLCSRKKFRKASSSFNNLVSLSLAASRGESPCMSGGFRREQSFPALPAKSLGKGEVVWSMLRDVANRSVDVTTLSNRFFVREEMEMTKAENSANSDYYNTASVTSNLLTNPIADDAFGDEGEHGI